MSSRAAVSVLAFLVLVIGLIVGLVPHSAANPNAGIAGGGGATVSCGSAFAPDHSDAVSMGIANDLAVTNGVGPVFYDSTQRCADALATPRSIGLALIGVGVLAGLFVLLTSIGKGPGTTKAAPPSEEDGAAQSDAGAEV